MHHNTLIFSSSLTRQPPVLHLRQSPTPADIRHHCHHTRHRQRLEQIPRRVIHEEHPLHRQHTPQKQPVGHGTRAKSLPNVIQVPTQQHPSPNQHRQRREDRQSEENADDVGRRFGVGFEGVVYLRFGRVAFGGRGDGGRGGGVGLNGQVKGVLGVGCAGAEGGEDQGGFEGAGGGEELVGEVFLGLRRVSVGSWTSGVVCSGTYDLDLAFAILFQAEGEGFFQSRCRLM